ncbi:MAG: transposase [Candidatus Omnitrophota bacterium]
MPKAPRVLLDNAYYHVITRGNQKRNVFRESTDYENYLSRLKKYKVKYNVSIYGYCLMPNHIHILARLKDAKKISDFMHDLNLSYTNFFNEKYKKVGYLWQGRFKSKIVSDERYLLDCIAYIECNPVRAELVKSVFEYSYSSYSERILEKPKEREILDELIL